MDHAAKVAFIHAQTVCAMAELMAMQAHDKSVEAAGLSGYYSEEAYFAVPDKYGISHNAVIAYLSSG